MSNFQALPVGRVTHVHVAVTMIVESPRNTQYLSLNIIQNVEYWIFMSFSELIESGITDLCLPQMSSRHVYYCGSETMCFLAYESKICISGPGSSN